ncbi:MAG: BMP family ABC transporter substrate-binding protein [Saccharofermentanales bacterium]|jgi:basic membrane protein A
MQHFKKWIALLLVAMLVFTVVACNNDPKPGPDVDKTDTTQPQGDEPPAEDGKLTMENVKVGFVHITDPSDMGYTYNHDLGTQNMQKELGLRDDQIINKFNTPEDAQCEAAIRELVEQGCNIIFATSFGFEDYMLTVAKDYPDVHFAHATGFQCANSDLPNVSNYFGKIYQARYLSGIAAGLKTKTNVIGYVCAKPFAECISGYDAFYLGAKSVNPDVTMKVMYTDEWHDPQKESQVAQALIDLGCDVLGQHCDSTAAATKAEDNGVFHVGYNSDMRQAAPKASMTSAVWDWSRYLVFAITNLVEGKPIPKDWGEGIAEGVCDISPLNEDIIAPGTAEAIEEARKKIVETDWDVFTGPLKDNEGNIVVPEGETFIEPQSAPSFDKVLEGIEVVGD